MHIDALSLICMDNINCFLDIVCPDSMFLCHHGRANHEQPTCISFEQRCDGITDCIGGKDELDHNCPCGPEGAVRLVDGIVPYRGRVELCMDGRWRTICSSSWDHNDAAVVCRQLGYPTESKHVY